MQLIQGMAKHRNLAYELVVALRSSLSIVAPTPMEDMDPDYLSLPLSFDSTQTNSQGGKLRLYRPNSFGSLRAAFGIESDTTFLSSWPLESLSASAKSAGKSGSAFIKSGDQVGHFVIKTLIKGEKDTCLNILDDYVRYMKKHRKTTLLNWILVLGRLRVNRENVYFCVLNNVFQGLGHPTELYDLKGSAVNRKTDPQKLTNNPSMVRMDMDMTRKFVVMPDDCELFNKRVSRDALFLASHNIMDHSLIVGVFTKTERRQHKSRRRRNPGKSEEEEEEEQILTVEENPSVTRSRGRLILQSSTSDDIFVFGIIDILQDYNLKKKVAHVLKSSIHDSTKLSTVEPKFYGRRFISFLKSVFVAE